MSELQAGVIVAAEMVVVEYIPKALEDEKPFRSVGVAYILFASKEPQLFQLLFKILAKIRFVAFQIFFPWRIWLPIGSGFDCRRLSIDFRGG